MALLVFFLAVARGPDHLAQKDAVENAPVKQIKIADAVLANLKNGDYVYPRFSPDGKRLAYSNVLVETMENTEVGLFDLQKQTKSILLNPKQAKKFAIYAAFVSDLEWLSPNRLRADISDGDVDTTSLTFNTTTRRVVKKEHYSAGEDDSVPADDSPLAKRLYANFPEIERDYIDSAFNMQQALQIGDRGAVIQYNHADTDSNIWFLNFRTRKPELLLEEPEKDSRDFNLQGAVEVNGDLFLIVKNKGETHFYLRRGGKVERIAGVGFGGWFVPKFATAAKIIFLLKQPNHESEKPSSLWHFDGRILSQVSDVPNLCDVDIDKSGKTIAFSFWNKAGKRDLSVRKLKTSF